MGFYVTGCRGILSIVAKTTMKGIKDMGCKEKSGGGANRGLVTGRMLRVIKPQLKILHACRSRDPGILTLNAQIRLVTRGQQLLALTRLTIVVLNHRQGRIKVLAVTVQNEMLGHEDQVEGNAQESQSKLDRVTRDS